MPPKAVGYNMPNLVKNKKVKFSATMPQFQDQSQNSQQSESNGSSFERQDSNLSEEVGGSGSEESSQIKHQSQQGKDRTDRESDQESLNQEESQENSLSRNEQHKSNSPVNPQSLKNKKSQIIGQQTNLNQIQVSNVSYVSQQQQQKSILQQQVQNDDIDSNHQKNVVFEQIEGQQAKQQSFDEKIQQIQLKDFKVQKMIQQKEQQEQEKFEDPKQEKLTPQNGTNQKWKQNPSENHIIQQPKQRKKKKEKKDKKSKTKQQNLPQQDNNEQNKQKMDIQEQVQPQLPILNQKETSNYIGSINPNQQEQQESTNPFYQYIHPYLMLIGSNIIESQMSKKPSYRVNEASHWAAQLSQKILVKAFFYGLEKPQNIDEEQNQSIKNSIIQSKIEENKYYRKIQIELNQLAQSQSFNQIPLSKIYFLMKKFKIVASCIILEKKSKAQVKMNVSTSCFWNKEKDGQINFSYEGKNFYVMLTLYGIENPRAVKDQEERNYRRS